MNGARDEESVDGAMRLLRAFRSVFDPGAPRRPSQST